MRVVTVVQARSGSTRLPGKVMEDLGGAPVLARMLERVRAAKLAGTVVLATTTDASDEPVAAIGAAVGVPVVRGHPTDLLDRHVQAGREHRADVVVKIPSDCVLIGPEVIDEVIGAYLAAPDQWDYVSNLHPPTHPDGNDVEVVPMALLERAHREATRFRCLNVTWSDGRDLDKSHRVVLDYREDLELLRAVFAGVRDGWPMVTTASIADWMDAHPEAMALNAHLNGVNWYRHHLDELTAVTAADTRTPSPA
jgi:spore coat polysaccharide biosynthesis protein SpsF